MLGVTGYVRGKALTPDQLMHVPTQVIPFFFNCKQWGVHMDVIAPG